MTATIEIPRLDFTGELATIASEVLGADTVGGVQREEAAYLEQHDLAVFSTFARVIRRSQARGEAVIDASIRGFCLGTRAVRYAAGEVDLSPRPFDAVQNYYSLVLEHPDRLEKDFARDYAGHPAITELVERTIENPFTKAHAKLAFNLYGKEANPDRPLQLIPAPRPAERRSRRQFVGTASAQKQRRH